MQRIALLPVALGQSPPDPELINLAMQDKLHQQYRQTLIPGLEEIVQSMSPSTQEGLLGVCLSGAGPTILALATSHFDEIAERIIARFRKENIDCQWKILEPAEGTRVSKTSDVARPATPNFTGVVAVVAALVTVAAAQSACDLVGSQTSIESYKRFQPAYTSEQTEYWSTACGDLKPSCILMPTTTQEVSAIVSILAASNETFAVKSGGHNPNNYFASVDGGPLISTKNLDQIIFDPATKTVRVGPGNRWDEVSKALDGSGYSVVGGRIGNVGVGGYMLGAGLSFMSTEYGWAANSVLEYELVLANASIVHVTEHNHPDLFIALKGGG
ncbi:hypothetical protein NUW58_g9939 [Xylaria curta]|uniref:Uncharacterized protein n=1 Tax=Xylaria curta TaxID=42375 RepID=A0ACC1MTF7_9PEZI|nr:hypothetical protein NUW58_g9939 [Xylaria curta]